MIDLVMAVAVYVLGASVYAFVMAFAWPPTLEYGMWDTQSLVRVGIGAAIWPVAVLAVLPFLAFKYGEYRRKKVLETGE